MARKVVIQKVDLDTALTALFLGVSKGDTIVVVRDQAPPEDLENPEVLCIECGGSGEVERGNFDHHNTEKPLPPACVQAFQYLFQRDLGLSWNDWGKNMTILELQLLPYVCPDLINAPFEQRMAVQQAIYELVDYVAIMDTEGPKGLEKRASHPLEFPALSDVFSGMLLTTKDPKDQLFRGMEILWTVLEKRLCPFERMPELPEWREYIEAKRKNDEAVKEALRRAEFFVTKGGLKAAFVESEVIGVLGALYKLGFRVVIAYCPKFGNPPVPKYTIGGDGVRVDVLRPYFEELEPGWGGPAHGTILGSPRGGSKLPPQKVKELVCNNL